MFLLCFCYVQTQHIIRSINTRSPRFVLKKTLHLAEKVSGDGPGSWDQLRCWPSKVLTELASASPSRLGRLAEQPILTANLLDRRGAALGF